MGASPIQGGGGGGVTSGGIDTAFGSTQGQILYRGASAWTALDPGTSGHYLKTQGAAANPAWAAVVAGGETLAQTLALGASTGANDITITSGRKVLLPGVVNYEILSDSTTSALFCRTTGSSSDGVLGAGTFRAYDTDGSTAKARLDYNSGLVVTSDRWLAFGSSSSSLMGDVGIGRRSAGVATITDGVSTGAAGGHGKLYLGNTLLFNDGAVDIGESISTFRPRDLWLSRNASIGGALDVAGTTTVPSLVLGSADTSGTMLREGAGSAGAQGLQVKLGDNSAYGSVDGSRFDSHVASGTVAWGLRNTDGTAHWFLYRWGSGEEMRVNDATSGYDLYAFRKNASTPTFTLASQAQIGWDSAANTIAQTVSLDTQIKRVSAGVTGFYAAGSTKGSILTGSASLDGHATWATDNTYDVGASGATRPRTGYFGTSVVTPTITLTTALAATMGGTGQTSFTTGDLLYASNSTTVSKLAAGSTSGHVLTSNGAGAAPSYQAVSASINGITVPAAGRLTWNTGSGAVTHLLGPTDQNFKITAESAGASSAGCELNLIGGAGGSTSGTGGIASLVGGAGTAGNSAGGVSKAVGGAGQGSAAGGAAQVTGGAGGATGTGGACTITSGAGGATSGASGAITIASGATTSGSAGDVSISCAATTGSNNPGNISITAGAGGNGTSGGGKVSITGGVCSTGNFSSVVNGVTITGGASVSGTFNSGGWVTIVGGASNAWTGGTLNFTGGEGGGAGTGGGVNLNGGQGGATGAGGSITLQAGLGQSSSAGGDVTITAGRSSDTGTAGAISITAGLGAFTSGAGGTWAGAGGNAQTSGAGGACSLAGGSGLGTDKNGGALTLRSGLGTGTGTTQVLVQTPYALATGTTAQTIYDRLLLTSNTKALSTTTATATTFCQMNLATSNSGGGCTVTGTIEVADGSNHVGAIHFTMTVSAVNQAGTVTANCSTFTDAANGSLITGGTFTSLTTTTTVTITGTAVNLRVTPSWAAGTPTSVKLTYQVQGNGQVTFTPQ